MNLTDIDLNLLSAFDVLMDERSVTKAAKRLYVSQSAMSHTLRRLRELLDDPILVPSQGGMLPTQRALELVTPIREALGLLNRTISPPANFTPATSSNCFVLGSTDYVEYVILPPLIKHLAKVGPDIRIRLKRFNAEEIEEHLERRDVDLVIRLQQPAGKRLQVAPFIEEMLVVLVRKHHPLVGKEMDMELFSSLKHVVIDSFEAGHGAQQIWNKSGINRNVALQSPNFLSAPLILAESDMIATLPLEIARMFTRGGRLKIVPCPLAVDQIHLEMVWHNLLEKDMAQIWFREQVQQIAKELEEDVQRIKGMS